MQRLYNPANRAAAGVELRWPADGPGGVGYDMRGDAN
jgi:hypothetical protein